MGSKKERKLKAQAKKTTQNSSAVGTEKQPVEKKAKKLEQKLQITTASRPLWTIVIIVVGVMQMCIRDRNSGGKAGRRSGGRHRAGKSASCNPGAE